MHQLDNRTPYAADKAWLRDQQGTHVWAVAIKATFDIAPNGELELADEQMPPNLAPIHLEEPGASSLAFDVDVTLPKPTTDVFVTGSAHAQPGGKRSETAVALRFGKINKVILVRGPSYYVDGGSNVRSADLSAMPVTYENAYGGADTTDPDPTKHRIDLRNPVGTGFVRSPDGPTRAPSAVYPGRDERTVGPAGFGPIESFWEPRIKLHGTFDAQWVEEQRPFLPRDWQPQSLLAAPLDQRPERHLRGGEQFEVVNMSPRGVIQFALPKIYLALRSYFGSRTQEHRAKIATVHVLADEHKVLITWQSSLEVTLRELDYLDRTLIREKPYL